MSRPPTPPWQLPASNPRTHRGSRNSNRDQARRQALTDRWTARNAVTAGVAGAVVAAARNTATADVAGVEVVVPPVVANTAAASVAGAEITVPSETDKSAAVDNAFEKLVSANRQQLISAVFWICDVDHDNHLNQAEMLAFARHIGFDEGQEAWQTEFSELCAEYKTNPEVGINHELFYKLLSDTSDRGCFCTDVELRKFLEFLGKLTVSSESSASSSQPQVGSVAVATRGSAAGAATPGSTSVAAATGGPSSGAGHAPRERTPRRDRSPSATSTTSSAPSAPAGPLEIADPAMVARVWDNIAAHLDSN
jgi:hypothetical protein